MTKQYEITLKPILIKKIEEAINQTNNQMGNGRDGLFPWIGDECFMIMADAAICVLRGMQDAQDYLEKEDMLET